MFNLQSTGRVDKVPDRFVSKESCQKFPNQSKCKEKIKTVYIKFSPEENETRDKNSQNRSATVLKGFITRDFGDDPTKVLQRMGSSLLNEKRHGKNAFSSLRNDLSRKTLIKPKQNN